MPDTTPLPAPECPREGCPATIDHVHNTENGDAYNCPRQLGRSCPTHYYGGAFATRCYAPRTATAQPAPARPTLRPLTEDDLIAARVPVWQPVAPGTVIKAGTRWRFESGEGATLRVEEETAATPYTCSPSSARYFIDPRTVRTEPEDPAKLFRDALIAVTGEPLRYLSSIGTDEMEAALKSAGLDLTPRADQ